MATEFQVTIDCADPARLAEFWAEALGYIVQPPPEPFASWEEALDAWRVPAELRNSRSALVDPDGKGPRVFFQQVPEPKSVKNRLHLDLRIAVGASGDRRREALEAEAQRLVQLGATVQRVAEPDGFDELFIVMQDPESNEFCLD